MKLISVIYMNNLSFLMLLFPITFSYVLGKLTVKLQECSIDCDVSKSQLLFYFFKGFLQILLTLRRKVTEVLKK